MQKWWCCDFETSNSQRDIEENNTRVWLWDIYDPINKRHLIGRKIKDFCQEIFKLNSGIFYFHNLKFDGSFLLNYLVQNGFKINDSGENGTISTLITDRLIWYQFVVYVNGKKYKFRDSAKKIIGSLEKAAEDFELPIRKGKIDYALYRDDKYIPTNDEIEYIKIDTEIMGEILKIYYENGMNSLTNATDAMKSFKSIIGEHKYARYFPVIPKSWDDFIRRSYKGGYCYLNPKYKEIDLDKVYCYDVKSMYPSRMVEEELPWGVPEYFEEKYKYDENYPLFIQRILVDCKLKDSHFPTIQSKSFLSVKLNYMKSTEGKLMELTLTSLDLQLLEEHYEIYELHYVDGFKFHSMKGLFEKYIMYYFNKKEASKGAVKQLYKIFLNSLYGKFAMQCERSQAELEVVDGINHFNKLTPELVNPMYTAVASFITAAARFKLINSIWKNKDKFVYCDTDSMHLLEPAVGVKKGKCLGDWAIEHGKEIYKDGEIVETITDISRARYIGQKCYILQDKDGIIKKIAGAPDAVKMGINFDNFYTYFTSDANLYPKYRVKNVKNGVLLIPTSFTIKAKSD